MAILNYTTSVPVSRSLQEIQTKLAKAGARAVQVEFSAAGTASGFSFQIETPHGEIFFRFPANIDAVFAALKADREVERRYKTMEHAHRVAWRIAKDWLEAQLAIIEAGMATLTQVFLPYAQTNSGATVYELFMNKGLPAITHQKG